MAHKFPMSSSTSFSAPKSVAILFRKNSSRLDGNISQALAGTKESLFSPRAEPGIMFMFWSHSRPMSQSPKPCRCLRPTRHAGSASTASHSHGRKVTERSASVHRMLLGCGGKSRGKSNTMPADHSRMSLLRCSERLGSNSTRSRYSDKPRVPSLRDSRNSPGLPGAAAPGYLMPPLLG